MSRRRVLLAYILIVAVVVGTLNMPVRTMQAIDHRIAAIKIPLYVKLCGFFYRDYMYKELSVRILNGIDGGSNRVMALYNWTVENIKNQPKGFSVIDDHVWDIIARRYGLADQMADVFTTLASYSGYEAFWYEPNAQGDIILSFVRIDDEWRMFDIYNRRHFTIVEGFGSITPTDPLYEGLLKSADKKIFFKPLRRADKHKLLPRIFYELSRPFLR